MTKDQKSASKQPPVAPPLEILSAPSLAENPVSGAGQLQPVEVDELGSAHKEFAGFHQGYVSSFISLADTKASWVFALASGAILYFLALDAAREQLLKPSWSAEFLLLGIPLLFLGLSSLSAFLVIVPRLPNTGEGFVFYGAVAKWKSAESYINALSKKREAELTSLRLHHTYDLSRICIRKYGWLRKSMWFGVLGLLSAVAPLLMLKANGS